MWKAHFDRDGNFIQGQWIDEDTPQYEDNGKCPVCGGDVYTDGGNFEDEPMQDVCYDCGWTSDFVYG